MVVSGLKAGEITVQHLMQQLGNPGLQSRHRELLLTILRTHQQRQVHLETRSHTVQYTTDSQTNSSKSPIFPSKSPIFPNMGPIFPVHNEMITQTLISYDLSTYQFKKLPVFIPVDPWNTGFDINNRNRSLRYLCCRHSLLNSPNIFFYEKKLHLIFFSL